MNHLKNRKYNYDNAAKAKDLIPDEFVDSLGLKAYHINRVFNRGKRTKREFTRSVFLKFIQLLVNDCIENNNKFIAPLKNGFQIYIKEKGEQSMRRILNNKSTYNKVDLLESDFKIYEFVFHCSYLKPSSFRNIRISHTKYMELIDKVNKGKRYREK